MGAAFQIAATLETMGPCYKCGVEFAAPAGFVRQRREDSVEFFCPNGHGQIYKTSELTKLKEQLEVKERALAAKRAELEMTERRLVAQRAQTTKARNQLERVGNGVCPCCNRSFTNLRRHMDTKHPEMKKLEPSA